LPDGTVVLIVNLAGTVLIAPAGGVALYWAGTTLTGQRSLSAAGLASIQKIGANQWIVSGAGLS
jgi:hypothetical protein